jgi:hypothetical protein
VLAMTVNPAAAPDTPAPFRDEAVYSFHVDTNADGRADVSLDVRFGEVVHVVHNEKPSHAQRFDAEIRSTGDATQLIASGTTGVPAQTADSVRVFTGVVHDVFAGDAGALGAFTSALAAGRYEPQAFENRVNFFADLTVAAIVVELPDAVLGGSGAQVQVWSTISLVGHAPTQQVARWGLPLFTHLFLDEDRSEAFNRTTPSDDNTPFITAVTSRVERCVSLAGTSADPRAYADRVVALFGSITLPYTVASPASFDYAGFNGRGLADNVMDNMLSLLTNSPLGTGISPDPARIAPDFPYFTAATPRA